MSSVDLAPPLGDRATDAPVYCVLTRFGLRSPRHLASTYRDYRGVIAAAEQQRVPGLLKAAFLVENPTTCYSLSLWSQEPFFSADVPEHVDAVRRVFGRLRLDPEEGPELWSTRWRLASVTNNLRWSGFDLGAVLDSAGGAP